MKGILAIKVLQRDLGIPWRVALTICVLSSLFGSSSMELTSIQFNMAFSSMIPQPVVLCSHNTVCQRICISVSDADVSISARITTQFRCNCCCCCCRSFAVDSRCCRRCPTEMHAHVLSGRQTRHPTRTLVIPIGSSLIRVAGESQRLQVLPLIVAQCCCSCCCCCYCCCRAIFTVARGILVVVQRQAILGLTPGDSSNAQMLRLLGHRCGLAAVAAAALLSIGGPHHALGSRCQLERSFELEIIRIAAEIVGSGALKLRCGSSSGSCTIATAVGIDHGCRRLGVHGAHAIIIDPIQLVLVVAAAVAALAPATADGVRVAATGARARTGARAATFDGLKYGRGRIILLHGRRRHCGRSGEYAAQRWRRCSSHIHVAAAGVGHFRCRHVVLHVGHRIATFGNICVRRKRISLSQGRVKGGVRSK